MGYIIYVMCMVGRGFPKLCMSPCVSTIVYIMVKVLYRGSNLEGQTLHCIECTHYLNVLSMGDMHNHEGMSEYLV